MPIEGAARAQHRAMATSAADLGKAWSSMDGISAIVHSRFRIVKRSRESRLARLRLKAVRCLADHLVFHRGELHAACVH